MLALPLALYVHIPWCVRKCPYCDFNSHRAPQQLPEDAYSQALLADLDRDLEALPGAGQRPLISIFIGGGTPSLFSPKALAALLEGVADRLRLVADAEITLEANPGTVEQNRFRGFRAAGVNRLSLGIQSFDDAMLRRLGRIHDAGQARTAVAAARAAGFDNINLDLMYALPDQDLAAAERDLATAIALQPTHISHYQLTLEPDTVFYKYPPPLPDDEIAAVMLQQGQERLTAAGYRQYEVSAYAQAGRRCRHNLNYWEFGDYLGIGAGAHGKYTLPSDGRVTRVWKTRNPTQYLAQANTPGRIAGRSQPQGAELAFEFMLNVLRLCDGVATSSFSERTGLAAEQLAAPLAAARSRGLLQDTPASIRPTVLGMRFLNDLQALFLPDR